MSERRRSWWAWGYEDEEPDNAEKTRIAGAINQRFGIDVPIKPNPDLDAIDLPAARIDPPTQFESLCRNDPHERARHAIGHNFRDLVRKIYHQLPTPPDFVVYPETEADVVGILDWCSDKNVAAIPYGGGSSVVAGYEFEGDGFVGVASIDMTRMNKVLEVDPVSRAARIQGGALGPELEAQLRPHGYTLRHFPQSFEFSTLGGWLATRSGGHYATVYTHIDDMCESLRAVTPAGVSESFRLPGSGAGPSHDRLFMGSEGALGIITEAWMRIQDRPTFKASATAHFTDTYTGADAVRALTQSALFPTNCRLLDPVEAAAAAGVTDGTAVVVLGFESADHDLTAWMDRAIELCNDHGATAISGLTITSPQDKADRPAGRDGTAGAWRNAFIRAPYDRNSLAAMSMITETFETSTTWDRFPEMHAGIMETVSDAVNRICGSGAVSVRFTHAYPDGPAPYYTILAPGRPNSEIQMWDEIKAAASDALIEYGSTITHHHAVGRDHDPWYQRQISDPMKLALAGAKSALDPAGVMNPGVIVPAR